MDNWFNGKIAVEGDCWIWQGFKSPTGYGRIGAWGSSPTAPTFVYKMFKGEIPLGLVIAHSCDRRDCVNPEHLEAMTQKQNIQDMFARGRNNSPCHFAGENNPSSKLSDKGVWQIKDLVKSGLFFQREVATLYGIKKNTVSEIASGNRRQGVKNPYLKDQHA